MARGSVFFASARGRTAAAAAAFATVVAAAAAAGSPAAVSCDRVASTSGSDSAAGSAASPYRTAQKLVDSKVVSLVDYGVFVRIREGVEALVPSNELVEKKDAEGNAVPYEIGDPIQAEVANVDSQDRRVTLSMRIGEAATAPKAMLTVQEFKLLYHEIFNEPEQGEVFAALGGWLARLGRV